MTLTSGALSAYLRCLSGLIELSSIDKRSASITPHYRVEEVLDGIRQTRMRSLLLWPGLVSRPILTIFQTGKALT